MASKRKSFVAGKSTAELLNLSSGDVSKLTRPQLAQVVSRVASAANKRLKGVKETGRATPAYTKVMESGGKFSTRGKSLNQLRSEFLRAKQYMESQSSTIARYDKLLVRTARNLSGAGVTNANPQTIEKLLKIYGKIYDSDPQARVRSMKYEIQRTIGDEMLINPNMSIDGIVTKVSAQLSKIYERNEATNNDYSEWFNVEDDL